MAIDQIRWVLGGNNWVHACMHVNLLNHYFVTTGCNAVMLPIMVLIISNRI